MALQLVAFCGLAGAGKTTAARWMQEHEGFTRLPFADPIKTMCRQILTARQMSGDSKEVACADLCGKSPRQFMQILGTEFGRDMIGADFWVKQWRRAADVAVICDYVTRIVVDDVRFANESAAIRVLGGTLVRLVRAGSGCASSPGHRSERDNIDADVTMHVHSVDDLHNQVRKFYATLF